MEKKESDRALLQRFNVQKFLGKGSYGSVFRVKKLDNSKVYALKETNVRKMSQEERADAVNEIRLLASVQHQHIITYHEAFIDGNRLCIIMEYAQNGDLARAIRKRASQCRPFPEDLVWSYFIQIVRALQALHARRILHRDVKSGNVLRVDEGTVKLGDLGIAKLMKHNMTKTQIGTPHYMPPEVWRNKPYSFSSDIWSLGCLLFELCTFNVPFPARDMKDLRFKVLKGKLNPIPRIYSSDLNNMIRFLMQPNASDRPTADEILSFDIVQRRMHLAPTWQSFQEKKDALLNTIKVPKNFRLVAKRLPKPFYPDELADVSKCDVDVRASNSDNASFNTAASWPRRLPNHESNNNNNCEDHLPPIDARTAVSSPGHMHRLNPTASNAGSSASPDSVSGEVQSKAKENWCRNAQSSANSGCSSSDDRRRVLAPKRDLVNREHHQQQQQKQPQQLKHGAQGHYRNHAGRRSYDPALAKPTLDAVDAVDGGKYARMSYDGNQQHFLSYAHFQQQQQQLAAGGCYFPWNNPISRVSAAAAQAASRISSSGVTNGSAATNCSSSVYDHAHSKAHLLHHHQAPSDMHSPENYMNSGWNNNVKMRNHNHRYKRVGCPLPPIPSQSHVEVVDSRFYNRASVY